MRFSAAGTGFQLFCLCSPDIGKKAALNFQVQHSIGENVAWENHTHTSVLKTGQ